MHPSAFIDAQRFVDRYLGDRTDVRVADVGALDINGSLKSLLTRPNWQYTGLSSWLGPNVDQVLSSEDHWPEIADARYDVVVASQVLEHVRRPWRWMSEVVRICAPGGLIYVCAPNTWDYHGYPVDCWRVWPEGLQALFDDNGIEPLEIYASGSDTTGIGRRPTLSTLSEQAQSSSLTVLCLTTGQETLGHTLNSLRIQGWSSGDQVLLVHDGPVPNAVREAWHHAQLPGRLIELPEGPHGDWGHTPRNKVLATLRAGYVLHLDDDDALAPGAVATVHDRLRRHPGAFFLFRMTYSDGRRVWDRHEIEFGNVGTGIFVHPAGISMGRFAPPHSGDFDFIRETLALNPDRRVVWDPATLQVIRPQERWRNPGFVDVSSHSEGRGREDCQAGWQAFFGRYFHNCRILDVGAGLGHSRERLSRNGNLVTLHDVVPNLDTELTCDISDIADKAFDVVTAFDVVEHVDDAYVFIAHLVRIACRAVVVTTPNAWIFQCQNPHHLREFSPPGLLDLFIDQVPSDRLHPWASSQQNGSNPSPYDLPQFLKSKSPLLAIVALCE